MMDMVFTIGELAQRWKCSADIVYDLLRKKQLRGFKLGSSWRITADAVAQFENN